MPEITPPLADQWSKLSPDDPRRRFEILDTAEAIVPESSKQFLDHKVDTVRFPNGNIGQHHRLTIPEGVMVAHIDEAETVALVDNYRHPIGRFSRELPSGGLEPDEAKAFEAASPEERQYILELAAIREFCEEVGRRLEPHQIRPLFPGPLQGSVGFADQTYHIYHGEGGAMATQSLDDGEAGSLTHDRYSIGDAAEMIGHEIVDPATSTAVMALANVYGVRVQSLLDKARARVTIA